MSSDYEVALQIANDKCISKSAPAPLLRKRPNWTEIEKKIVVEEVQNREDILFGKFKGGFGGKTAKENAWAEVAAAVNGGSGSGNSRTSSESQKQYSNLKQRAKGKLSEMKRPKTGGGPKPSSPSPAEKAILDNLGGRPSLEGICGGIDTANLSESQPSTSSDLPSTSSNLPSTSSNLPSTSSNLSEKRKAKDSGKLKRKMTILELEERNLTIENEKFQEEIKKIKDERDLIRIQKSFYEFKIQILVNSHPEVAVQMLHSNEM
ncbi:uncharacterized protein LOC130051825 [Ostrea edulis]|uniref:uncharacterized protein LOC130051825 n=1 Tax=Ostrea edulis TaxID=37623 RepID=UPI0024AEB219|nr:uncharacterized protein LOC130051825 [Ostrea edulis]